MKIATYNVNSIKVRAQNLISWLKTNNPDIVLLQEIKCETENFLYFEFETLGYKVVALGQKGYNGVAILSKYDFEVTNRNLPNFQDDSSARYIEILVNTNVERFYIASVYAPNGCSNDKNTEQEKLLYKLKWFDNLYLRINNIIKSGIPIIVGGDFNVMMENIDVFDEDKFKNSPLYLKEIKDKMLSLSYLGLYDCFRLLYKNKEGYTFWDYSGNSFVTNLGLRIDYVLASSSFADRLIDIYVDKSLRQTERPSDHTVLIADFRD